MAIVTFHPLAREEYLKGRRWYERRVPGLGGSFEAEVDRAVQRIAESPERWPTFGRNHRWVRVRRFNYVLYYANTAPDRVLVVAVAHGRKRPRYWTRRRLDPPPEGKQ